MGSSPKESYVFKNIPPFLIMGIGIALAIGILLIFSYLLIWGMIIGGILWIIHAIVRYFTKLHAPQKLQPNAKFKGRIIDHEDLS